MNASGIFLEMKQHYYENEEDCQFFPFLGEK